MHSPTASLSKSGTMTFPPCSFGRGSLRLDLFPWHFGLKSLYFLAIRVAHPLVVQNTNDLAVCSKLVPLAEMIGKTVPEQSLGSPSLDDPILKIMEDCSCSRQRAMAAFQVFIFPGTLSRQTLPPAHRPASRLPRVMSNRPKDIRKLGQSTKRALQGLPDCQPRLQQTSHGMASARPRSLSRAPRRPTLLDLAAKGFARERRHQAQQQRRFPRRPRSRMPTWMKPPSQNGILSCRGCHSLTNLPRPTKRVSAPLTS